MSILIKGMKIPKDCIKCPFCRFEDGYWKCLVDGSHADFGGSCRPFKCPLIELPPHGRLVDADEMYGEFVLEGQRSTRYKLGEVWELNGKEIRRAIYRLPTVIPAEEGER